MSEDTKQEQSTEKPPVTEVTVEQMTGFLGKISSPFLMIPLAELEKQQERLTSAQFSLEPQSAQQVAGIQDALALLAAAMEFRKSLAALKTRIELRGATG